MRYSIFAGVLLLLGGCSTFSTDPLSEKYAEAARQMGINPVYPPREEFQIGDVYLVSTDPKDPNNSVSLWLGTLPELRMEADKFLASRVVFQDTGVVDAKTSSAAPDSHLDQADLFSPQISTRASQRVLSLPVAAYPSFTTQAGFTQSTGLTAAMAAIGFGTTDETTVTLDFTDVRSYWVPQVLAAKYNDAAMDVVGNNLGDASAEIKRQVQIKEFNTGDKSANRCLRAAVVTRVYLTRQILYTYRDRQIIAAGLKVATQQGEQVSTVAAPPAINVNVQSTAPSTGDAGAKTDADALSNLAENLRQQVVPSGSGGEGGSFSFVSWNARGLSFQQTYQRPVAIGWEGFDFDLSPGMYAGQPSCVGSK